MNSIMGSVTQSLFWIADALICITPFCASQLAGMESGYACFCGNEVDSRDHGESPSMECNHVCFGDHTQPCGGDGWVIIFDSEC